MSGGSRAIGFTAKGVSRRRGSPLNSAHCPFSAPEVSVSRSVVRAADCSITPMSPSTAASVLAASQPHCGITHSRHDLALAAFPEPGGRVRGRLPGPQRRRLKPPPSSSAPQGSDASWDSLRLVRNQPNRARLSTRPRRRPRRAQPLRGRPSTSGTGPVRGAVRGRHCGAVPLPERIGSCRRRRSTRPGASSRRRRSSRPHGNVRLAGPLHPRDSRHDARRPRTHNDRSVIRPTPGWPRRIKPNRGTR